MSVLAIRQRAASSAFATSNGVVTAVVIVAVMILAARILGIDAFAVLINGLAFGALYAVVALGYTMVYGIIELINFAHGDVFALGAFISLTLMEHLSPALVVDGSYNDGVNSINFLGLTIHADMFWLTIFTLVLAVLVAAILCGIVGVLIERIAYRPLRNAPRLAPLITAIGMSLILENLLFQWKGGLPLEFPSVMNYRYFSDFGPFHPGTDLQNIEIIVIIAAVLMMIGLDAFVNRTKLGKAMRAVAQDREAAQMMGINVDRIISLTFFVGSALAGAGAVIYGIQITTVSSSMGFSLGLFAFTAAVLGGIGNIRGAMLGGFMIGIIERFVDALGQGRGTEWSQVAIFAVLILILIFRPSGLLGSQVPEKV